MKAKNLIAAIAMILGISSSSFAQVTAYANIYCSVVAPIGIVKTTDMNFGEIITSPKSGTLVLSAGNSLSASGVDLGESGKATLASFTVTGSENATFDITVPTETYQLSDGSSNTMLVSNFTSTPSSTGALAGGSKLIQVGATLHVSENQAIGNYSSQNPFYVKVNYN